MKHQIITFLLVVLCFGANAQELQPISQKRDWKKYLTQKQIVDYIKSAPTITKSKTKSLPFKNLEYNKVIAYDYEGNEEAFGSITKEGHFIPVVTKQKALNQKQSEQIIALLTDKKTYGESTAACFNPHMAVVFFKDSKVVFKVDICLSCNYLTSSEEIPAMLHKKITFETGNFTYAIGFTASGKKRIKALGKELDFFYGK